MEIILSGVGFRTSEPLRTYAERRVLSWLGHLERELEVVVVQLADNRTEEGQPARCRLLARTARGEPLVVEEASADAREAIDGAPERMARALERATRSRSRRGVTSAA